MFVTGVQPAGAKGLGTVQVAAVDTRDSARVLAANVRERGPDGATVKPGDPEPVVFPRDGVPLDKRPVSLRREHAVTRYRDDGEPRDERRSA
jgi:hypothetical protein